MVLTDARGDRAQLLVAALLHLLEGADVESVFWQRGAALRRWCSVAMLGGSYPDLNQVAFTAKKLP